MINEFAYEFRQRLRILPQQVNEYLENYLFYKPKDVQFIIKAAFKTPLFWQKFPSVAL